MKLQNAIRKWEDLSSLHKDLELPEEPEIKAKILEMNFDGHSDLDDDVMRRIEQKAHECFEKDTWDEFKHKEWKLTPLLFLANTKSLADNEKSILLLKYLEWLQHSQKRTAFRYLITAYLLYYSRDRLGIQEVASVIKKNLDSFKWSWSDRHQKYELFALSKCETRVAKAVLDSEKGVHEVLKDAGISGTLVQQGLAEAAFGKALPEIRKHLVSGEGSRQEMLDKLFDWCLSDNDIQYGSQRGAIAETLLLPWTTQAPPEYIQERIQAFLLDYYGDPRIGSQENWLQVSEEARQVLRRWLTKESLEQFLKVVDKVADRSQWKYRKSFWGAYYDKGFMQEAWVAFGPQAQRIARRAFDHHSAYGKIYGGLPDHSVLIMKIGNLIVADWSHSGRCHAWKEGNPNAPKLYQRSYESYDLKHSSNMKHRAKNSGNVSEGVMHFSKEKMLYGGWQQIVADFIKKETGMSVSQSEIKP